MPTVRYDSGTWAKSPSQAKARAKAAGAIAYQGNNGTDKHLSGLKRVISALSESLERAGPIGCALVLVSLIALILLIVVCILLFGNSSESLQEEL